MSRFDAALIPEHFEVDVESPIVIRCAHWGRCWWSTDFDGDDVRPIRDLLEAAQQHLAEAHAAETACLSPTHGQISMAEALEIRHRQANS